MAIVLLVLLIPSICACEQLSIDGFQYTTTDAAFAVWKPDGAALSPEPAVVEGVKCLRLPCRFRKDTTRAIWDKQVDLNLSDYDYFSIKIKFDNPSAIRMVSVYFKSGAGNGWYGRTEAIRNVTEKWHTIIIPKSTLYAESPCPGWNDIRTVRISVWQSYMEDAAVSIADFSAQKSDGIRNILPNSGFELCNTESIPDYWGTGHWGIGSVETVTNTGDWRRRWTVDNKVIHSGKRSLRIEREGAVPEMQACSNWVHANPGDSYVFSAWIKSDNPDMPVALAFSGSKTEKISVGKEWQRFCVTGKVDSALATCRIMPLDAGTVWIDDTQFEAGIMPSEYRSAITDKSFAGEIVHRKVKNPQSAKIEPYPDKVQVKIDENRRFLVNGKPFIPFAMGWESVPQPEIIHEIAHAGFNTVCIMAGSQPVEDIRKLFDVIRDDGMRVILWVGSATDNDMLQQWINGLKDHPALLAWYICDEPEKITPQIQDRYDLVKKLDPTRPVYINYTIYNLNKLGDIASLDDYPIPESSPAAIAGDADMLERCAIESGKPTWIWLQAHGYAYCYSREPTGPEEECMTYLALIHGARGISYFAQKPHSNELWNEMKQLAFEVRTLTPVLYSLEKVSGACVDKKAVHLAVKRYKGEVYLIAVNERPNPITVSFTVPGADRFKTEVLFENRKLGVKHGRFTDHFEGYQRHVYKLRCL
ncbi:MAG: hypothetical protein ABFD83_13385 [Armatimonadota bacterium]